MLYATEMVPEPREAKNEGLAMIFGNLSFAFFYFFIFCCLGLNKRDIATFLCPKKPFLVSEETFPRVRGNLSLCPRNLVSEEARAGVM